jgi:hypothetical protein
MSTLTADDYRPRPMGGGFDPRLGRAFTFGPDDLAANRRGQLSRDQQVMFANAIALGVRRERRMLPTLSLLLAVTVVAAIAGSGADPVAIAVVVVMLAFIGLLVMLFRRRDVASRAAMSAGTIETVEGRWELDPSLDGTWRIRVGGRLIAVERLAVETLADDGVYRFHLLPQRGVAAALSVERVS